MTASSQAPGTAIDPSREALQRQIDELMALPEDEQLAVVAQLDLDFETALASAQESGLEAALGGAETTRATLASLSDSIGAFGRETQGQSVQLGLRKSSSGGEHPTVGGALFGSYMVVSLGADIVVSATNGGQTGSKTVTDSGGSGELTVTATAEGVEFASNGVFTSGGGSTSIAAYLKSSVCPDETGQFTADAAIEAATTAGPSAGQTGRLDVHITGHVDDGAKLASTEISYRMKWDGFAGGSFVDLSWTESPGGKWKRSFNGFNWFTTTVEQMEATEALAGMYSALVELFVTKAIMSGIESGRCVRVAYTVSEGPTGLAPEAAVDLTVSPVAKSDSRPTGGTVTATLSAGGGAVAPSGTPVPADASFVYTAPSKENEKGTVAVEARSKRGVGRATIDFDTKKSGYVASGGTPVSFSGTVSDLAAPFVLQGAGPGFTVQFSFSPSDARSGSLTYSGSGAGVTIEGSGSYSIAGDDPVLTLSYEAQGCATPGGCRATSNQITLTLSG